MLVYQRVTKRCGHWWTFRMPFWLVKQAQAIRNFHHVFLGGLGLYDSQDTGWLHWLKHTSKSPQMQVIWFLQKNNRVNKLINPETYHQTTWKETMDSPQCSMALWFIQGRAKRGWEAERLSKSRDEKSFASRLGRKTYQLWPEIPAKNPYGSKYLLE